MTRPILDLGSWCILRMASGDTLRVVEALIEEGLGAWTPLNWRIGRTKITRSRFDEPLPLMPGYAFGDVGHIDQIVRLSGLRRRDLPRFWFLESERHTGCTPLIVDGELGALRREEERLRAVFEREKRRGIKPTIFGKGTEVKMIDGAYAGLSGVVEGMRGKDAIVSIPGFNEPIKVASLLLLESVAKDVLPHEAAARAA
jgi:hypothetical protein